MTTDADNHKVAALRELLPATGAGIYLDTATRGPLPAEAAAAMREAEDWELTIGRVWEGRDEDVVQRHDEARAVLAALLHADPGQITLTHGRDDARALALAAYGDGRGRIVDATPLAGAVPIDATELGADAIFFATDRWLLGPEGTGAVWLAAGGDTIGRRELPRTALIGLARSVGWLEMYVGLDWVFERTTRLAGRLYSALAVTAGVEVLTPPNDLAAIIEFRLAGWTVDETADELSRRVHALVRPLKDPNAIRASVGWFNTEDELDRFADAVAELARYTPASLPRRPSLIVLADS
jgi:selenocysteine lyase/cysteine desulfurase